MEVLMIGAVLAILAVCCGSLLVVGAWLFPGLPGVLLLLLGLWAGMRYERSTPAIVSRPKQDYLEGLVASPEGPDPWGLGAHYRALYDAEELRGSGDDPMVPRPAGLRPKGADFFALADRVGRPASRGWRKS